MVRGTTDEQGPRFSLALRLIEGVVDRARFRSTLVYRFHPRFQAGVEYNPIDEDVGLLANWRLLDEGPRRPALILGTSSDRIGTTDGRSYYGTLSKDLESWTGLPVAPYVGAAYGEFEDDWKAIGGLNVRWPLRLRSTHLFDGEHLHHVLTRSQGNWSAGIVLADQDDGLHFGVAFGLEF